MDVANLKFLWQFYCKEHNIKNILGRNVNHIKSYEYSEL